MSRVAFSTSSMTSSMLRKFEKIGCVEQPSLAAMERAFTASAPFSLRISIAASVMFFFEMVAVLDIK